MLKKDVLWPISRRFKSGTEWEPVGFFSEALCNSIRFDLKLGFFSSSAINVLSDGFAAFLYNGGRMRMIINDILSEEDQNAIYAGESDWDLPYFDLNRLNDISKILSRRDMHFFECLAWLIRNERIEIKVIVPKYGQGISHSKCGLFGDGLNKVAFEGSCNFTRTAMLKNMESITAFCDWDGQGDINKIADVEDDFEKTFSGKDDNVEYLDVSGIKNYLTTSFKDKEIKELLDEEEVLINEDLNGDKKSQCIKAILMKAHNKVTSLIKHQQKEEEKMDMPKFPFVEPRDYQKEAYEKWKNNNQKGLFAMATGTGKTLTSLNCLLHIYEKSKYYKAIILVPTLTLVDQWEEECRRFHFNNIIKVCSHNSRWKSEVDEIKLGEELSGTDKEISYVIICTYSSFARENVFHDLTSFNPKTYRQLLLIADECHNMGSGRILARLGGIKFLRRIGLSATPQRQYDEETNSNLLSFFGCNNGYTFEYSMRDAIDNGFLCHYRYFPHLIRLTSDEMKEYIRISLQLIKFYDRKKGVFNDKNDFLRMLLLKRKRIIHKASGKAEVFKEIMEQRYKEKGNLKYSLVYVPEGSRPDDEYSDDYTNGETTETDDYTDNLIDQYTGIVKEISPTTTVKKFVSGIGGRDAILEQFAKGEIEVLTSMKCLDEGIDVPRSEFAVFCSSTGNPRQFIQRRGRILRKHPEKYLAIIHDLVVVPEVYVDIDSYNMERNMLSNELKRVRDFANLSENADTAFTELENILSYYNLSIF